MFDSLSDKLQKVFKNLRGEGKLTAENMDAALREIRVALLEADVHFKVVKGLIEAVKEKMAELTPTLPQKPPPCPGRRFCSRLAPPWWRKPTSCRRVSWPCCASKRGCRSVSRPGKRHGKPGFSGTCKCLAWVR